MNKFLQLGVYCVCFQDSPATVSRKTIETFSFGSAGSIGLFTTIPVYDTHKARLPPHLKINISS